jgi:hypothetical protein
MTSRIPYELETPTSLHTMVYNGNKRPAINEKWPAPIKSLLKSCWELDFTLRPTMESVEQILRAECIRLRDGNDDGLEHQRRRSTFVLGSGDMDGEKLAETPPPLTSDAENHTMAVSSNNAKLPDLDEPLSLESMIGDVSRATLAS